MFYMLLRRCSLPQDTRQKENGLPFAGHSGPGYKLDVAAMATATKDLLRSE